MSDSTGDEQGPSFQKEVEGIMEGAAGLFGTLREIFDKSRDEIARASRLGKTRIDLFQLEKDREHFLQRLGEECFELMKAGIIEHEDLVGPFEKLTVLDERKAEYEAEVERIAAEQHEAQQRKAANDPVNDDVIEADVIEADVIEADVIEASAPEPAPAKEPAPKKKPAPKKDL